MTDTVLTSIIGALGAVSGATITAAATILTNRSKNSRLYWKSGRESVIEGIWKGSGTDFFTENGTDGHQYTIKLKLKLNGRKIVGEGDLGKNAPPLELAGGFYDDSYIQLTYQSTDQARRQMGVIMFRVSGDGRKLKGHYAGYSPSREIFVVGSVDLAKI